MKTRISFSWKGLQHAALGLVILLAVIGVAVLFAYIAAHFPPMALIVPVGAPLGLHCASRAVSEFRMALDELRVEQQGEHTI